MGATSASISSGLNPPLSAALSGAPGNARNPTSTQIRDFLRAISMFPPTKHIRKWREKSSVDFAFTATAVNIIERRMIPAGLTNEQLSSHRGVPQLALRRSKKEIA
jgi:hypothetical protein